MTKFVLMQGGVLVLYSAVRILATEKGTVRLTGGKKLFRQSERRTIIDA